MRRRRRCLTSRALHERPVGGVHLVDQDEPQGEERRHEERFLSLHRAEEKETLFLLEREEERNVSVQDGGSWTRAPRLPTGASALLGNNPTAAI